MRACVQLFPGLQQQIFERAVSHSLGGSVQNLSWLPPGSHLSRDTDCLLALTLGKTEFSELAAHVRDFRSSSWGGTGCGTVSVDRGVGLISQMVCWLTGMPRAMCEEPFSASVAISEPGGNQHWTRVFGDSEKGATAYSTVHRATRHLSTSEGSGVVLTESLGLWPDVFRLGYQVTLEGGNLIKYDSLGLWAGNLKLPLPKMLTPTSRWTEASTAAGWRFDGELRMPRLFGGDLLMHYRGDFEPLAQPHVRNKGRAIVSGGTGLVGSAVCRELVNDGWEVIVLSRKVATRSSHYRVVEWDGRTANGWSDLINSSTVLVNLAGENPGANLWTAEVKDRILTSRLNAIRSFGEAVAASTQRGDAPLLWVQASAAGIFGDRGNEVLSEDSTIGSGTDFRTQCCTTLEHAAATQAHNGATPLTVVRLGHVLSSKGGLLPHLEKASIFRARCLGGGQQFVPWVHISDVAKAISFMCNEQSTWGGNVCVAAPGAATNAELFETLAYTRHRSCLVPLPAKLLRQVLGESASVVLDSQRMEPARLCDAGFRFSFPTLRDALVHT